jgi:hypothetical protein
MTGYDGATLHVPMTRHFQSASAFALISAIRGDRDGVRTALAGLSAEEHEALRMGICVLLAGQECAMGGES